MKKISLQFIIYPVILIVLILTLVDSGYADGPGIGSGGDTTSDGVPVSSRRNYIVDPTKDKTLAPLFDYAIRFEKLLDRSSTRSDIKQYFKYVLLKKSWYWYEVDFKPLPNSQINTMANLRQPIFQSGTEVQVSRPLIKKTLRNRDGVEYLREIIFREYLEALLMLTKDSSYNQCLAFAPNQTLCDGTSTAVKADLTLNGEEHSRVREVSRQLLDLLDSSEKLSGQEVIYTIANILHSHQFDISGNWILDWISGSIFANLGDIQNWLQMTKDAQLARVSDPNHAPCLANLVIESSPVDFASMMSSIPPSVSGNIAQEVAFAKITFGSKIFDLKLRNSEWKAGLKHGEQIYRQDEIPLFTLRIGEEGTVPFLKTTYTVFTSNFQSQPQRLGDLWAEGGLTFRMLGNGRLEPSGFEYSIFNVSRIAQGRSRGSYEIKHEACEF